MSHDIQRSDPLLSGHMGEIHFVREHAGRLKEIWHEEKCIFCGKWHGYDRLKWPQGKPHCGNETCADFYRRHKIHQALKNKEMAMQIVERIHKTHKEIAEGKKIKIYTS